MVNISSLFASLLLSISPMVSIPIVNEPKNNIETMSTDFINSETNRITSSMLSNGNYLSLGFYANPNVPTIYNSNNEVVYTLSVENNQTMGCVLYFDSGFDFRIHTNSRSSGDDLQFSVYLNTDICLNYNPGSLGNYDTLVKGWQYPSNDTTHIFSVTSISSGKGLEISNTGDAGENSYSFNFFSPPIQYTSTDTQIYVSDSYIPNYVLLNGSYQYSINVPKSTSSADIPSFIENQFKSLFYNSYPIYNDSTKYYKNLENNVIEIDDVNHTYRIQMFFDKVIPTCVISINSFINGTTTAIKNQLLITAPKTETFIINKYIDYDLLGYKFVSSSVSDNFVPSNDLTINYYYVYDTSIIKNITLNYYQVYSVISISEVNIIQKNVGYKLHLNDYKLNIQNFTYSYVEPNTPEITISKDLEIIYYYNKVSSGTTEVIDLWGLVATMVSIPFTFLSQAFNLTLFAGTPYAFNFSSLLLTFVCLSVILLILKIMKGRF